MLELKDAIKQSFHYLDEMLYDGKKLPNKLLEEIEYDDEKDIWKVVIGFDTDIEVIKQVQNIFSSPIFGPTQTEKKFERKYKQIQLRGNDGKFVKMIDQML